MFWAFQMGLTLGCFALGVVLPIAAFRGLRRSLKNWNKVERHQGLQMPSVNRNRNGGPFA